MDVRKHYLGHGLGRDDFYLQNHGFTLIELLVTLAVVSIVSLSAFPSLASLIAQERSTVLTNALASSLAFARSEAVARNSTIITCQSDNGSECSSSASWHKGWIIFADKNQNKQREANETLLLIQNPINNGTEAVFKGSGAGVKYYLKYKPSGSAWPNGSFLICNSGIGRGKALIMAPSGRLRLSKTKTNGSVITCN